VEAAREGQPAVILLDMNLPVMDGWTVARTLKDDPTTHSIPIIALTAHALVGDREKAIAAGCDDYHPKPVDFSRLLTQIDAALGNAV
jgi:CheY-like chemotaxis protein